MGFMVWLLGAQSYPRVYCPRCNGEDHRLVGPVHAARTVGAEKAGELYGCLGCGLGFGVVAGRVFKVGERAALPLQSLAEAEGTGRPPAGTPPRPVVPMPRRDTDLAWGDE